MILILKYLRSLWNIVIIFGHNIMKTVKELIDELKKFPEDAECFAYEGEDSGISIHSKDNKEHGFIFCQGAHFKERPTIEFGK